MGQERIAHDVGPTSHGSCSESSRRLLLFTVVVAVLAGVVAMHVLGGAHQARHGDTALVRVGATVQAHVSFVDHASAPTAASTTTVGSTRDEAQVLVGNCAGSCEEPSGMIAAVCLIALALTGGALLLARPRAMPRCPSMILAARARWTAVATAVRPPSLTALCISRT